MDVNTLRIASTLVCFAIFLGIAVWAYSGRNRKRFEEDAAIPFQND